MGSTSDLTLSQDNLTLLGSFTLTSGTFTAPTSTMPVSGDRTKAPGATFNHNQGTVQFNSTHTITGDNTSYNLTKTTNTPSTLTLEAGSTQTIENTLTLKGGDTNNLLSLRSTQQGTQWNLNPQGTRDIAYLDVQDSRNTNAQAMDCINLSCTNSGNNTNWMFLAAADLDPEDTPSSSSRTTQSVSSQVANLLTMGNYEQASQLMAQWPYLFPDGERQLLLAKIQHLQREVIRLLERLASLLQQQVSATQKI